MAGRLNIPVDTGSTVRFSFANETGSGDTYTRVYDFTGATITMTAGPLDTVWGRRNMVASSTGDGITVNIATGLVTVELSASKTSVLVRSVVYDVEASWPNGEVHRLVEGRLIVDSGVRGDSKWSV